MRASPWSMAAIPSVTMKAFAFSFPTKKPFSYKRFSKRRRRSFKWAVNDPFYKWLLAGFVYIPSPCTTKRQKWLAYVQVQKDIKNAVMYQFTMSEDDCICNMGVSDENQAV